MSNSRFFLPREQLEDLLDSLGVSVQADTSTDLIAYCPFHSNRDSPAFNISLSPPHLWKCHNGKCGAAGNIISLLTMKGYSRREAEKMVVKGNYEIDDFAEYVKRLMAEEEDSVNEWCDVDPERFQAEDRSNGYPARMYLFNRGITIDGYNKFQMGYSAQKRMLVIPVLDANNTLSGIIGREITSKRYQYSTGLERGKLVWNLQSARAYETIILTEGALDAVYVWQAGYENVGAVFGSSISPQQWRLLREHFTEIICFFDNDDAGKGLTETIIEAVHDITISYVTYPDRMVTYVDSNGDEKKRTPKDPGELSTEEIRSMVENRKTSLDLLLSRLNDTM